jgi:membrane protein implicated in regulation of membrane protease activity
MIAPTMTQGDEARRRAVRRASIVIAAAMLAWFGLTALGGALGLPPGLAFVADLAALAALGWAMVTLYRVWRARRGGPDA